MQYKTSVHPLWFTVALSNVLLLLTPGLVLADKINQFPTATSADMAAIRNYPPLPEQLQEPSLILSPKQADVSLEVVNDTNATVIYQLVGETEVRTLAANSQTQLRGLEAPTTLTFQRADGGFVVANIVELDDAGMLRLVLDETADLGDSNLALNVDPSGKVFLN